MSAPNVTLDAGRELDALVAEKVIGWQWSGPTPPSGSFLNTDRGFPAVYLPLDSAVPTYTSHLPNYSTDIAAAWHLVDALHEQDMNLMLEQCDSDCVVYGESPHSDEVVARAGQWAAWFQTEITKGRAGGDTPALAICRAALQAVSS